MGANAEKHPELVAIVIQTQTADFAIAVLGSIFQDFTDDLTSSLNEIAAAMQAAEELEG